jgi:Ca2+:H+ antiporter
MRFRREERIMALLLLFVPATLLAAVFKLPGTAQFFLAVIAIVPLAAFIGSATEALAARLGGRVGGLLNATFGNSPDLLVGFFGVQKGLIVLVKATLVGALISNSALIMGLCYIGAGLRWRSPRFNRREAGHHSLLMMLTVAAFLFPSTGALVLCHATSCTNQVIKGDVLNMSIGISIVLLLAYAAYVAYGIFGLESFGQSQEEGRETRFLKKQHTQREEASWPIWFSIGVLVVATVVLIPTTDILTSAVTSVTDSLHWSQVFVGMIIVANAGNVAEGYAALKFAILKRPDPDAGGDTGLDLAFGIASASSIQIATFIAPLVVFISLFFHPMNLVFSLVELAILGLLVVIFAHTAQDGEANWLEGAQLLALYAMAAIVFFTLPETAFG